MKRSLFTVITAVMVFTACMKDSVTEHYTFFRPVYQTKEAVKSNIGSSAAIAVERPGKIVTRGQYVFLNDVDKGIHVIDIANPARPKNIAFIHIPGCVDIAINGNYLYADCYTDLVTLDISNPLQVTVKQFLNGVFPHRYYNGFRADTNMVIQKWVRVDTAVKRRFHETGLRQFDSRFFFSAFMTQNFSGKAGVGIAGSLARFGLLNNHMYTVSRNDLKVFNTTQPASPAFVKTVPLQQGDIETIFPYKNNLFIGTQSGMFIYSASNPDQPQKLGQFTHARACDPVIADDKYAYVTLQGGTTCGGFSNQLDVIDINNISNPVLVKTYQLTSPKGLSKDGNLLFICDGKSGVKIFDATNAAAVTMLKQISGFEPQDIIAFQGLAITVAKDGLYFIDYTDVANARLISKINIVQN